MASLQYNFLQNSTVARHQYTFCHQEQYLNQVPQVMYLKKSSDNMLATTPTPVLQEHFAFTTLPSAKTFTNYLQSENLD